MSSSILIKDPYLQNSADKNHSRVPDVNPRYTTATQNEQLPRRHSEYTNYQTHADSLGRDVYPSMSRRNGHWPNNHTHSSSVPLEYQRELHSLSEAYEQQSSALNKMQNYQNINQEYYEAMKSRNFELNVSLSIKQNKVNDLTYQLSMVNKRHEEDLVRTSHDKDQILGKYEEQNEEILRLKRTASELLEQKARLEAEVQHLMFSMEKDNHQGMMEIKEQLIRTENVERTLKSVVETKDEEIAQLRHRLKVYEDQNRRLNDLNRTMQLTAKNDQARLDNLSKIDIVEETSHHKSPAHRHGANKENLDANRRDDLIMSELRQQKQINQQLISELDLMKKKLFQENSHGQTVPKGMGQELTGNAMSGSQIQKECLEMCELRKKIVHEPFSVFSKSVSDGEKFKKNSLIIFIENWKCIGSESKHNIESQVSKYFAIRDTLRNEYKVTKNRELRRELELSLPLKIGSRPHSEVNEWILSTMQMTKNQRSESSVQNRGEEAVLNDSLLYLFRLLTIQYRAKHPMQGKSYVLDTDVRNELLHSIVKALQAVEKSTSD